MYSYCFAGYGFYLPFLFEGLEVFQVKGDDETRLFLHPLPDIKLLSTVTGWVWGRQNSLEVGKSPLGMALKLSEGYECHIIPDGSLSGITFYHESQMGLLDKPDTLQEYGALLGPALVLALGMNEVWCLHGSAVVFHDQLFVFLGESGFGKSTLAAYLSEQENWQLLADDILPVTLETSGLTAWPHFPQLKLPADAQPGFIWPEQVPISVICLLHPVDASDQPKVQSLSGLKAMQSLLSHTAGTRLLDDKLLEKHLEFCAQAVEHVSVYQLSYPHSKDALPQVKDLLENLC